MVLCEIAKISINVLLSHVYETLSQYFYYVQIYFIETKILIDIMKAIYHKKTSVHILAIHLTLFFNPSYFDQINPLGGITT